MTLGDVFTKFSNSLKTDGFIHFSLFVFLCISLLFITRLWELQIVKGGDKREFVRNSAERTVPEHPRRGRILDRNGNEIAFSVPQESGNSVWTRVYTYTKSAPLIGFVKRDITQTGLAGIERAFDNDLAGEVGFSQFRRDGRGNLIPRPGRMHQNLRHGSDVHLTIDLNIQRIVDDVLAETVRNSRARGGMAIVMNPHTGEIYAMASNPSFDPNVSRTTVPKNRAIGENYEPGSIFKIITFAAALNEGLIAPDQLIDCNNGVWEIPNERPIRDPFPMGEVSFSEAFRMSSNIASLRIAREKLGNRVFYNYIERFGMGAQTGIGLFEEERGILAPFNNWRDRDAMSISFGNAVAVTLLQMAVATSSIANGGYILRPQIYRKITDERGRVITGNNGQRRETKRTVVRQVITEQTAETMRAMMSDVVNERGTGRAAFIEGLNIGGKTGTSRIVRDGKYLENNYWASFIGITPIDQPALVSVVSVYDPQVGRFGGPVAGAAVAQIMKNIVASPSVSIGKDIRLYRDTTEVAAAHSNERQKEIRVFPNLTGLDLRTARRISSESRIDFEIMGTGNVVLSQSPVGGIEIGNYPRLVLFTDSLETQITMPNFVGVNVRDAIEMLRQRGITPTYVEQGIGRVRRQYPTVGTFWQEGSPCSLFVEKGISDLW